MIIDEKKQQPISTELNDKLNLNPDSNKSNINTNLNHKKENKEIDSSNYFEETDSLKFDSSYKAVQCDNPKNILRKSSTLSTNISQSESPQKNDKESSNFPFVSFNRERFYSMPVSNYFDGIDNYFKGLYPEKNNYQKSKNYLEKKYFFREHFPSVDIDYVYKKTQKIEKLEKEKSQEKVMNSPATPTKNSQNLQNININNNIEFPFYYLGYCGIDCKPYNYNII